MDLLEGLNEAQKKAVLHKDGPLLVLAGAGAGKTKAIAHRVAYLVSQGVAPEKILAITFTNKAAGEMRERISNLLRELGFSSGGVFVSTFHSLGVFILRQYSRETGVVKNFSILDQDGSLDLIKESVRELNLDEKQFQPTKIQSIISRYKGDLFTQVEFENFAGAEFFTGIINKIWKKYEEKKTNHQAVDFDDLILKPCLLLKNNLSAREYYQNLWQYILIDEYQDTNKSQYELSKFLAGKNRNICAIGDIDQAIYGWRGADFRNIINFEKDFSEHTTITFEENYRSTQTILEAAAKVIEKNKMRKEKKLVGTKHIGAQISLFEAMSAEEEAEFVAHKIKELLKQKERPSEIAVLYRANFQSRIFEEKCLKHNIPYQVLGTRFYERKEVKDIFAFLRASLNPENLVDIKRIINVPPRGLGKATILNFFAKKKLPAEAEKKVANFMEILQQIKGKIEVSKPSEVVRFALKITGYQDYLAGGNQDDLERLENLQEMVSIAVSYDKMSVPQGTEQMLTDASLVSDQDSLEKKKNAVRLMTVHAAKGLEFENVFVVGLEEGLFPHGGFGDNGPEKQEEERRLFYVAITRAKERLLLSFSVARVLFGSHQLNLPSRFISDIPPHLLKAENYRKEEEIIEYL